MNGKFAIAAVGLFTAVYIYVVMMAKTIFDAAWMVAIFTIPASTVADILSRLISGLYGSDANNIYLDLVFLFLLGVCLTCT